MTEIDKWILIWFNVFMKTLLFAFLLYISFHHVDFNYFTLFFWLNGWLFNFSRLEIIINFSLFLFIFINNLKSRKFIILILFIWFIGWWRFYLKGWLFWYLWLLHNMRIFDESFVHYFPLNYYYIILNYIFYYIILNYHYI